MRKIDVYHKERTRDTKVLRKTKGENKCIEKRIESMCNLR